MHLVRSRAQIAISQLDHFSIGRFTFVALLYRLRSCILSVAQFVMVLQSKLHSLAVSFAQTNSSRNYVTIEYRPRIARQVGG